MVDSSYQLKVTLRAIRPAIWRRVRIPSVATLRQVHDALQIAFGWTNSHLHQFLVGRQTFGMPDPEGLGPRTTDERRVRLCEVADVKSKLIYEYDFGDGWEHEVLVERVDPAISVVPECLDGRRARPPEDCGGPHGYAELVETLADPKHPEHSEMREWVGPYWQPEEFDLQLVNKELRKLGARWQKAAETRRARSRSAIRPAND
jgi:hypothetical protein